MKSDLILIGGGGHCRACIDVIRHEERFRIAGILDRPEKTGGEVDGIPVIGTDDELPRLAALGLQFLVTVGHIRSAEPRVRLFEAILRLNARCATVVSPRAYVAGGASLGPGTIVMHDALVNADAVVGANCIINTKALVEHDAVIGDHCHVSTAAVVNGGARLGRGVFFGSNAVCPHNAVVPDFTFVRAGSLERGTA